jgi:hypothetical protein
MLVFNNNYPIHEFRSLPKINHTKYKHHAYQDAVVAGLRLKPAIAFAYLSQNRRQKTVDSSNMSLSGHNLKPAKTGNQRDIVIPSSGKLALT